MPGLKAEGLPLKVNKLSHKKNHPTIGRAKTVFVFETEEGPIGILSEVLVRTNSDKNKDRLAFKGPVVFKAETIKHLETIVLAVVDRITDSLSSNRYNYQISVKNIGATASAGIGMEVSGFSSDLPILFAMLSAALNVAIRQDLAGTGHIASLDGDIASVKGIPAKLEAVVNAPEITGFVIPEIEQDESLKTLTPIEYQSVKEILLRYKNVIKICPVKNVYDAIKIYFMDNAIVFGSLKIGFFNVEVVETDFQNPIEKTVGLFCEGNDDRFWDCLGSFYFDKDFKKAKQYLIEFVRFHKRRRIYPNLFGEKLYRLIISVPPSIRNSKKLFPLFPIGLGIKLSQYAKESDHADVQRLFEVAFSEKAHLRKHPVADNAQPELNLKGDIAIDLFNGITAKINKEHLSQNIGQGLDSGRATYATDGITVNDGFEFNEEITSFRAHLYRYSNSPQGHAENDAICADAIDVVSKAFEPMGGYKAALSEGKSGTHGGMRRVFDVMTDYLKQQEMEKYLVSVFKEMVDPLDFDTQVELMEVFKDRIKPIFSDELKNLPAKQLTSHWETIIRLYVESFDQVSDLMKRL